MLLHGSRRRRVVRDLLANGRDSVFPGFPILVRSPSPITDVCGRSPTCDAVAGLGPFRSNSSPLTTAIEPLARLESSSNGLWASSLNFGSDRQHVGPIVLGDIVLGNTVLVKRPTACLRPAAEKNPLPPAPLPRGERGRIKSRRALALHPVPITYGVDQARIREVAVAVLELARLGASGLGVLTMRQHTFSLAQKNGPAQIQRSRFCNGRTISICGAAVPAAGVSGAAVPAAGASGASIPSVCAGGTPAPQNSPTGCAAESRSASSIGATGRSSEVVRGRMRSCGPCTRHSQGAARRSLIRAVKLRRPLKGGWT